MHNEHRTWPCKTIKNKGAVAGFLPTTESNLRTALGLKSVNSVLLPAFANCFQWSCFQIYVRRWIWVCRCAVLQGWFKIKTTSIFPVNRLASLILMSKYAQSRQFLHICSLILMRQVRIHGYWSIMTIFYKDCLR